MKTISWLEISPGDILVYTGQMGGNRYWDIVLGREEWFLRTMGIGDQEKLAMIQGRYLGLIEKLDFVIVRDGEEYRPVP